MKLYFENEHQAETLRDELMSIGCSPEFIRIMPDGADGYLLQIHSRFVDEDDEYSSMAFKIRFLHVYKDSTPPMLGYENFQVMSDGVQSELNMEEIK